MATLLHGGPLAVGVLADARHLPHGRSRAGDRHLKFYETRDNLPGLLGTAICATPDDSLTNSTGGGPEGGREALRRWPEAGTRAGERPHWCPGGSRVAWRRRANEPTRGCRYARPHTIGGPDGRRLRQVTVLDVWLDEEMRNCRDRTRTEPRVSQRAPKAIEPGETTVMYTRPRRKWMRTLWPPPTSPAVAWDIAHPELAPA